MLDITPVLRAHTLWFCLIDVFRVICPKLYFKYNIPSSTLILWLIECNPLVSDFNISDFKIADSDVFKNPVSICSCSLDQGQPS